MIGIESIARYLPEDAIDNLCRLEEFGITREFVEQKTGILKVAR
jgi:hypothetical protein